ncbi:CDP-alcohol phosphatidyltransferase family protein [Chromohalobacter canadensis]|uniref:CDP-alcohol phosphatidyltransferase family protein n=1 Tax=Chromohalobacter canadensis TaxID=141389 RepID=UPI0021C00A8D|nr:CDP-alcohol phosphatidyltransferase family protein [Chromohalobacter canadensis]MCT8467754.1 CDP-alcohol phosphatidyltransferase family protein [Chromohalobacter canadensis]MCT8470498.1 CDP-alcohol phosphatidyltransferase family protein [Chromohalobacter canadensis]MCT8498251.1 CDP-alcohol phosphatidyltransferase family protein [Chromohalobacter canadensis]
MLDKWTNAWVAPVLARCATGLGRRGVTPTQLTVGGFAIGMLALPLLAYQAYGLALMAIVLNRVCDGLDGALARHLQCQSDAGGFLDIVLDFVFYAAVVLGFALADPVQNALPAAFLLFAFMGTGASFLAFAIAATRHGLERPHFEHKAFYYLDGLTEGTETIIAFVVFCLWPVYFPWWAVFFALACLITTAMRIGGGYRALAHAEEVPRERFEKGADASKGESR